LFRELVVDMRVRREAHNRNIALAWSIAKLSRAERVPPLQRLLELAPAERTQTPLQQRTMLSGLADQYGLKLTTAKKRKPKA
jgi:hypothetical protein